MTTLFDPSSSFDSSLPSFDTLMTMALTNPEGFERLRQQEVDALIASAPEEIQQRLRGLQFQIDAQRQIHKTPMGACIKISNMMHESFAQLRELLSQFSQQRAPLIARTSEAPSSAVLETAEIIDFPSR
ncbi:hypothetical protein R50073_28020 [Maricurvus nonylphenolicus]|uniref:DUF3135 domain-containing protein n=1 Tax=Maricurvus nonylphenolicus TaxID=1008307 RepID=UPI0036F1DC9F